MKKQLILKNPSSKSYIIIKNNFIKKYIKTFLKKNNKIFFIVDKKVKYLVKDFEKIDNFNFIYLKTNENIKNINSYYNICEKLLSKRIDRNSIIVSIGGGTLGDLCGFVAGTLLRGIQFVLIPTTLLSQVDSSIGGKNGINSKYGKNLIGTFKHPNEVIIDSDVLKTLPLREIKSGYSEILKHALIKDRRFFIWLDKNYKEIFNLNNKFINKAILKSILIKLSYVKNDVNEKLTNNRSRSMLNFGHTIGHALETFYGYKKKINHGEAISLGMIVESKLSNKLGYLPKSDLNKILDHFGKSKLKVVDKNIKNKKILEILLSDKKNLNNEVNITLLKKIGVSFFCKNIKIKDLKEIIEYN